MKEKKDLLKNNVEYEDYSNNIAQLTKEEMIELGIETKGGSCCSSKGCSKKGGCSCPYKKNNGIMLEKGCNKCRCK